MSNQSTTQSNAGGAPARYSSPTPPRAPANAATAPVRNAAGQQTPDSKEEHRRSEQPRYKVFGVKAGAVFELDTLTSSLATVSIEMAKCVNPRQYDWANKIAFQLTRKELPQFVGMLAGAAKPNTKLEFKGHGDEHDKNLRITQQSGNLLLTIGQKQTLLSVQIGIPDTFHLIALCMRALAKNDSHLDSQTILELCKSVCRAVPAQT